MQISSENRDGVNDDMRDNKLQPCKCTVFQYNYAKV